MALPWFWMCCTSKPLAKEKLEDDMDDFLFRGDRPHQQINSSMSMPICKHHRVLEDTDDQVSFDGPDHVDETTKMSPGHISPEKPGVAVVMTT
mmetsp:Transcript_51215/g.95987  ORF Transcript_51215/g.95987 Transcript_51215/m.95987 type:complete len:93 (-) Transcript_51215:283-561(-)